jgi:hypothetical protein
MRTRHILVLLGIAVLLTAGVVGCSLFGIVSISDRVAQFQTDLNTSDRLSLYMNFSSTMSDYAALKDPTTTINSIYPLVSGGTSYSLSVDSQSGMDVVVKIASGPAGYSSTYPRYMKLTMTADGLNNLISALYLDDGSGSAVFLGSPQYQ